MIDISTLPLDEIKRLYPIVSKYDAEAARVTGAKTMADLFRIQTAMFERLNREDKMFVRRDLVETEQALAAAAATLGAKGGAAGRGAAKRRDVDYRALGKLGGRPRGAVSRGFRRCSEWRGEFPVLIYETAAGEIEVTFSDTNTPRPHDHARTIRLARTRDDMPETVGQLRRWATEDAILGEP